MLKLATIPVFFLLTFVNIETPHPTRYPNNIVVNIKNQQNVIGNWQRKEDGLHVWKLNSDGTYVQFYNEEKQVSGKWATYTDDKSKGGVPDANGKFLWLISDAGETFCYSIEEASGSVLKLKSPAGTYEFFKI